MKIHLRADSTNAAHTTFTVFVNGANAGRLRMTVDEAASFHQIVSIGCKGPMDKFVSTGEWSPPQKEIKR